MKTWMYECLAVGITLLVTVIFTTHWHQIQAADVANWFGGFAVFYSFRHATVADRLAEAQGAMSKPSVECYPKLADFYFLKETFWVIAFVISGMYTALVGCGMFLAYPVWRKWYRRRFPRKIGSVSS